MKQFFSSESVTEGHPDKMCDLISDAILDAVLEKDPDARVACESTASPGLIHVMGELTTKATINIEEVVRQTVREIGYDSKEDGFDADQCAVIISLTKQSPDIAIGVDATQSNMDIGAGDQGMMFGYASNETEELMPAAIVYANQLTKRLAEVRKKKMIPYLCPDGKSQVTIEYDENHLTRVDTVLIAAQHRQTISEDRVRRDVINNVIKPVIPPLLITEKTRFMVNTTGRFVLGGPMADVGLTGRKIIVDTYGGYARHGGGAFSGKDPTKVDRTASYAMRYVAKNIVASGAAQKCELQIAYAIGIAEPVSLDINTFGTGKIPDFELINRIQRNIDLRPAALIERFDLKKPIYKQTAAYGHFGNPGLPWEKLDSISYFQG